MEEDNRHSDTVPEGSDVKPAEGGEKVSADSNDQGQAAIAALTLEELNGALKREFKSKEDALKAIKETYSFVGKKSVEPEKAQTSDEIRALRDELYFTKHPEYEVARPILEALAKANGQSLEETAESDVFRTTYSKIKESDESQSKATVMEGGRRFPEVSEDKQREFSEAVGDKEKMASYVLKHYLEK